MKQFYSIREASVLIGKKVRTIRGWISQGKIKAAKFPSSKRWIIPDDEIKRLKGE